MQDTVLQVGLCGDQVVISSTMITLNSLSDTSQRRIVADDVHEDESLTVSGVRYWIIRGGEKWRKNERDRGNDRGAE